jgi:hypothetical protein
MMRTARALYVEALDVLLKGRMAGVAVARDWDLLEEVARLATQDASPDSAVTDSSLFVTWREAVTKYHLKGWSNMTPERVRQVRERAALAIPDKAPDVPPQAGDEIRQVQDHDSSMGS